MLAQGTVVKMLIISAWMESTLKLGLMPPRYHILNTEMLKSSSIKTKMTKISLAKRLLDEKQHNT
jgi:hypothetical protein